VDDPDFFILRDVDKAEAADVVAQWLKNLPGHSWTYFLPEPK
jgi:hypothetical protein